MEMNAKSSPEELNAEILRLLGKVNRLEKANAQLRSEDILQQEALETLGELFFESMLSSGEVPALKEFARDIVDLEAELKTIFTTREIRAAYVEAGSRAVDSFIDNIYQPPPQEWLGLADLEARYLAMKPSNVRVTQLELEFSEN